MNNQGLNPCKVVLLGESGILLKLYFQIKVLEKQA